jgi:predicted nucleotide-binding protein (sugar kinase/HSP70/actin superfamily)
MLAQGIARLSADVCLPVKAFLGHAHSLVGHCYYLFVPSVISVEDKIYNCPKFIGLPDLTRAALPEAPPLLDPEVDFNKGMREFYLSVYSLGRLFTSNPFKVRRAAHRAWQVYQEQKTLKPTSVEKGLSIALIGHSYLLHDQTLNYRLVAKLERMGARVLFPDIASEEELHAALYRVVERPYWTYEDEVVGAGAYFLEKDVDGLVALGAMGCGPDSLMIDLLRRRAKGTKPFLSLVIDEHTSESGLITRLEAFVDMLGRHRGPKTFFITLPPDKEWRTMRILGIPNMGHTCTAFKSPANRFLP